MTGVQTCALPISIEVTDARPPVPAIVKSSGCVRTAKLDRSAEVGAGALVFWKLVAVFYPMVVQPDPTFIRYVLLFFRKPGMLRWHPKLSRQVPRALDLMTVTLWHVNEGWFAGSVQATFL